MAEMVYRQAEETDLPAVAVLYEHLDAYFRTLAYRFPAVENVGLLWVDSFRRTLGRFSVLFVAAGEEELVGFCLGRIKRVAPYLGGMLVGELSDIYVAPDARRLKVGHRLARLTFDWLHAQGVHSVEVQVLEGNAPSLAFFRSFGFKPELSQLRLAWVDYSEPEEG
jgi:ribosomal protein S18 acetylase RimI-like enzyme